MDQDPNVSHPDPEQERSCQADEVEADERAEDAPETPLDVHRELVRTTDDASRVGYSVLGGSTLVLPPLILLLSGLTLLSVAGVGTLLGSAVFVIVVGRRVGLGRLDARLRERVVSYCRDNDVDVVDLVRGALETESYEFFVKLMADTVSRSLSDWSEPSN